MTHKTNPISNRLTVIKDWNSRWFDLKNYTENAKQDFLIRDYLLGKYKNAGISSIEIERFSGSLTVIIHTSRPGIIIGRGGSGVSEIKRDVMRIINRELRKRKRVTGRDVEDSLKKDVKIEVREVRDINTHARLVASSVAEQLEKRMPFRRVIKRAIDRTISDKDVQGVKISVKGRLNGAEMAREEFVKEGSMPLQTFRADVDYAHVNAITKYGVIGVKVWIYKGEKLE